ncbi:MAG: paraquat-inducible protein A [Pseudomonadota bacterium]
MKPHVLVNLALLVAYPVAWAAPLMQAGLLPLFGMERISILSGLLALWSSDILLALIVALFALIAPLVKTVGLSLTHMGLMRNHGLFAVLGKLAMADIFLIALYITVAKGIGVGRVEPMWGLYLFTACVLASLWVSWATGRAAGQTRAD